MNDLEVWAVCPPTLFMLDPSYTIPSIQSKEFVGSGLTQFMKGNVGCIITWHTVLDALSTARPSSEPEAIFQTVCNPLLQITLSRTLVDWVMILPLRLMWIPHGILLAQETSFGVEFPFSLISLAHPS